MYMWNFVYIHVLLFSTVYSISLTPPSLLNDPDADVIADPTLPLELPCLAQGNPTPIYTWIKDGQIYTLNLNENSPSLANDSGTLVFPQVQFNDQGWYQCNVSNSLGTALSRKVRVRLAELGNFPISDKPLTIEVRRGDSLVIPCQAPSGIPNPEIYWTDNTNAVNRYGYLVSNPRIQQDTHGNLYFLNVKDEDEQKQFVCNIFSRKLNLIRRGAVTQLKVVPSEPLNRRPTKLWASESNQVFLKGQNMSLKCIFGGLPTPEVLWRKNEGAIPERRAIFDDKKQELIINNVQFEDSGIYQCQGQNEHGYDLHEIYVQIESEPTWKTKPKDTHVAEGDTVEFLCEAEPTRPSFSLQWSINGLSLQDPSVRRNSRRRISKNRLIIQNVTQNDIGVYQCNLSNIHGYIYANFFLNVISAKPDIQRGPDALSRIVEGESIRLACETLGVPKPKVVWRKRNQTLSGGRYSLMEDGSLLIRDAVISDSGIYVCNATNKFGSDVRNGTLNVKRKTQLQNKPTRQEIRRGSTALFRCTATSDSSLIQQIDWYKDGQLISYTGRFIKDTLDQNTLKIVNVQFDDSGSYTCRASTELDFDEASAPLIVQDRPNRPRITKVQCNGSIQNRLGKPFATVLWEPTGDNNAPILYYELQYNTSFQPKNWVSIEIDQERESFNQVKSPDGSVKLESKTKVIKTTHLPANQYDLQVPLPCWGNFTFRIFAYNRIGGSEPSVVTHSMCSTDPCRPRTHPTGVKASATPASLLLIEWESMPQIEWGAPKFWYEVGWRRYVTEANAEPFTTQRVLPPQRQYAIPNPSMNMRYQYYVKAVNQPAGEPNGTDAVEPVKYHVAFAGDSAPTYVPRNFRVLRMLDSTTVQFGWDPPTPSDELNIRGVLKGYQIEMFRLDDPENTRRIVSDILPNQTSTIVFNAPPNADVGAHICIETERYFGPTSQMIQFPTREGRPSPVTNLRAVPHSSNGIFLLWDPPEEPNGIIIGYQITYNTIENLVDQPGLDQPSILLRDDTRRTYLLGGLQPNRKYRVQVRAQTSAGLSTRPAIIELTTNQTLVPSKPTFIVTQRGQTFFNISFDPMIMTVPGSIYFVHYKETDDNDPAAEKKTYAVSNDRTILVNGLDPGRTYVTRLVAADGIESETASDPQMITTLAKDRAPRVINSPWFIGLIVALIVLMIVVAIVCGIMKRKGGKYSVQDKEMLHGPITYGEDEPKFSEYYRAPSEVSIKRSRTSLNNGDDRDSMAEFNDEKDRSRFQEDGSFIGQYGRDDLRRNYLMRYDEQDGLNSLDPGKSLSNV